VTHAVQPSACISHVCWLAFVGHCVALSVHAFAQHDAEPGAPEHAPLVQDDGADSTMQPCASVEHVAIVVELAQIGPVVVPHGEALQVHC
jgi:hypothetical protein